MAGAAAGLSGNVGSNKAWRRGVAAVVRAAVSETLPALLMGAGGAGGMPGGGAGGGGAATNGASSGAGGVGGRGEVWFMSIG